MAKSVTRIAAFALLGAAGLTFVSSAQAQDTAQAQALAFAELDRLSDLSANEESGIAAARDQAGRGQLLEALATLERVMAVYPSSLNARMLHAFYLCTVDDQQGARVEIDNMDEDDFGRQNLNELRARCPSASSEFRAQSAEPVQSSGKKG